MACCKYRRQGQKNLPPAVLNYKTSSHYSIGCKPTIVNHSPVPFAIFDDKLSNNPKETIIPTTEFAEEIQTQTKLRLDQTKQNIMYSYVKYEDCYDSKANVAPLKKLLLFHIAAQGRQSRVEKPISGLSLGRSLHSSTVIA